MNTGLVLEGGAMRGLFTAGALDVMLESDLRFSMIAGVSAGAVFGCNYKSHQIGRVLRYNIRYCREWRYCSWRSWLLTGCLFGTDFCYRKLPEELDVFDRAAYEADPTEFYLVCTDVNTGKAVYRPCPVADRECFEWMRASASMPLVSRIVKIGGGEYLDGALADSIPLEFAEKRGCGRNVVILTQPAGFVKQPVVLSAPIRMLYRKYPQLLEAMSSRHILYSRQLEYVKRREEAGVALVIRPERRLPIERISHSPEELRRTYELGREAARRRLPKLREFLRG